MTDEERAQVLVTARVLRAAASLQWLVAGMTIVAAGALIQDSGRIAPTLALIAGAVGVYFAFRVAFDARLFDDILSGRMTTADLDAALQAFGRKRPGRPWGDRCRGARRLVLMLAIVAVVQLLVVLFIRWP